MTGFYKPRSEHKNKADYSGKPVKVMDAEAALIRDAQHIVTSCVYCTWTHDGSAVDGRLAALEHRRLQHPEALGRKTPRQRARITPRWGVKPDDELIAEQNRVRAEREFADVLEKAMRGRRRAEAEAA